MAEYLIQSETLDGIASAIRNKAGAYYSFNPAAVSSLDSIKVYYKEAVDIEIGDYQTGDAIKFTDYAYAKNNKNIAVPVLMERSDTYFYEQTCCIPSSSDNKLYDKWRKLEPVGVGPVLDWDSTGKIYVYTDRVVGLTALDFKNAIEDLPGNRLPWFLDSEETDKITANDLLGAINIGARAFSNRTDIRQITIPATVAKIRSYAFSDCSALEQIVIPNSVVEIGHHAFNNCDRLSTVYYLGTQDEWNSLKNNIATEGNSRLFYNVITL
jgi:hypothetical protein